MSVGHTQPVQSETAPLASSPRTPRPAQDTGGWSGTTGTGVCMCVCACLCRAGEWESSTLHKPDLQWPENHQPIGPRCEIYVIPNLETNS